VAFLFLVAKISLYGTEFNVVLTRGLWPRSLQKGNSTEADDQVLRDITHQTLQRNDQRVWVGFGVTARKEAACDASSDPPFTGGTNGAFADHTADRPRDESGHPAWVPADARGAKDRAGVSFGLSDVISAVAGVVPEPLAGPQAASTCPNNGAIFQRLVPDHIIPVRGLPQRWCADGSA
jgi:hypothetical protein